MPAPRRGAITGATFGAPNNNNNNNTTATNSNPTMASAFSFGATNTPAAPAPNLFGGSTTPAPGAPPAPTFGSTPAPGAPAPFGQSPAPPPPTTFGQTPAPTTGGLFGSATTTPAPATGFGFGNAPGTAPATGFSSSLFGSTPATPAPATGFATTNSLFGSTTPAPSAFGAPASGGTFGGFGGSSFAPSTSAYGQPAAQPALPPPALSRNMPYNNLPPEMKRAIDALYNVMMQHKRTIAQTATMAPKSLQSSNSGEQQADAAAGQELPLASTTRQLKTQVEALQIQMRSLRESVDRASQVIEKSTVQATMYAKWPTEAVAVRRGVHLTRPSTQDTTSTGHAATPSTSSAKEDRKTQARLAEILDQNIARVDYVEKMPSPYMWETLQDMENRLKVLRTHVESLNQQLGQQRVGSGGNIDVTEIVKLQDQAIVKAGYELSSIHEKVDSLRRTYRTYEKGDNVLEMADRADRARQEQLDNDLKLKMIQTIPQPGQGQPGQPGTPAPAFGTPSLTATPASGGMFGGFGTTTTSAFGSTPAAPKPAFGAAPAGGSLFGSTPATPAPATGTSLFGATPVAAPTTAFGAATPGPTAFGAPAPTATPAFGAAPPAGGAPAFSYAPTPSTATTPKSKNKGRGSRRR